MMTACGESRKAAEPEKLGEKFEKTAVITMYDREYTAKLRRGGADIWECEFTQPETVAGLKMTASGDNCRLEFQGLEYTADRSVLPEYGAMPLITGALDAMIAGRDISCTEKDGKLTETGIISGQDFTARVSKGEIRSLEISDCLKAKFS